MLMVPVYQFFKHLLDFANAPPAPPAYAPPAPPPPPLSPTIVTVVAVGTFDFAERNPVTYLCCTRPRPSALPSPRSHMPPSDALLQVGPSPRTRDAHTRDAHTRDAHTRDANAMRTHAMRTHAMRTHAMRTHAMRTHLPVDCIPVDHIPVGAPPYPPLHMCAALSSQWTFRSFWCLRSSSST